jgi:probable HAF family extracellular repeat protein
MKFRKLIKKSLPSRVVIMYKNVTLRWRMNCFRFMGDLRGKSDKREVIQVVTFIKPKGVLALCPGQPGEFLFDGLEITTMKAIVLVLGATILANTSFGQSYQLTDLAALLGTNSYAQGINNDGQVVGYWQSTNGAHAFLYRGGAVTDLGLLGGAATNNFALSINNSGQVVGFSETTNGAVAFVYQNGAITNLGNFGGLESYAFGINDGGQIVGHLVTGGGALAYLYNNGIVTSLGTLGGTNSFAYGVNNALQVAGSSLKTDNLTTHAFLWQNGVIRDLNQLLPYNSGWELMEAHGINDFGSIAGWGLINQQEHAFLYYSGGWAVDLGTLPGGTNSYALGLNRSNVVVGVSSLVSGAHAVMWRDGSVTDLNTLVNVSGWELKEATGINDAGQIVGWGISNAQERAFLIQPGPPALAKSVAGESVPANKVVNAAQAAVVADSVTPLVSSLSIAITNPVSNGVYAAPTNLLINASASDSGGTVTQVQFYVGTRLLAVGTNSPYSTIWSNAVLGVHALTAVARDNAGSTATSSVVNISIATNLLPIADAYVRDGSFTNSNFGTNTVLQCLTTTTNGNNCDVYFQFNLTGLSNISSAKLNFFAQLSGTGSLSNTVYSVTNNAWVETNITWNNKPARVTALATNSISATNWYAYDVSSYVKSQATNGLNVISVALHDPTNYSLLMNINSRENATNRPSLLVVTTNSPLSVSLTNPVNNSLFAVPTNLAVNASVSDSDGTVTQVLFFQGTNKLGSVASAPYSLTWSNASAGAYALTAVASDSSGLNTTSGIVNVVFDVPPSITNPPTNQAVRLGSNAVFSVTATGTTPLSYRWLFNGTNVAGATNVTLTITNAQAASAGSYSVVVTNAVGSVSSSNAVLTLLTAPTIVVSPTNATVVQGSNATFSVTAGGTTPLSYQWSFGGTNLPGASNSWYTLANAQTNNAGSYTVTITNTIGSVSTNAVLTVLAPPFIINQPTNQAVRLGSNAVFSVTAGGTTPLNYQWLFNGTNVAGATNVTLTITNAQAVSAGSYSVVVTNAVGSVTSSNAVLTLLTAPTIVVSPTNATVVQGSNATFSVTAGGTPPLSYQWSFGGTNLPGATNSWYTLANTQTNNAGSYTVTITNTIGSVSTNAVLIVLAPPFISSQPTNQAVRLGSNAVFAVTAGGTPPLSYRWLFNGTNVAGATNVTLTITNAQAVSAGSYSVVVTNTVGSVTSSNAVLTLLTAPTIVVSPTNATVVQGSNAAFSVTAGGTPPLSYQWSFGGTNLPGATNSTYTLNNAQTNNAGSYTVTITNTLGNVNTNAVLTVLAPPFIINQPTNQAVRLGSNAVFSVTTGGTTPLGYRWLFNGTNVAGATNVTLTITNAQAVSAGSYSVVVTNTVGSVTSSNAVLTLLTAPTIVVSPTNATVVQGSNATFSVTAGGTPPLSYQWSFGGTNLPGATNSTYTLNNAQTNNAGNYTVTITNTLGSVITNAVLTVLAPPFIINQPTNQAVRPGSNAVFSVTAGGTTPLNYQWLFNGTNVAGATNVTLTITNVQTAGAGSYSVVVTNAVGSVNSANALLALLTPPTVALTNPPANSSFPLGSNIVLAANAADAYGRIVQVGFFQGANLLGIVTNAPYVLTWSNVTTGIYSLTAQAADSFGLIATSAPVNLFVGNTLNIFITSPPNGSIVSLGNNVNLDATAMDSVGQVGPVQFFSGTTLLGTVTNAPYNWTLQNPAAGSYFVTAQAVDSIGFSSSSSVNSFYVLPLTNLTNLVSWWRAEGNALDSLGTNSGTWSGAPAYAPGEVGQAFAFNGANYVATSEPVNNPQNFTLECWFMTTTTQGGVLIGFGDQPTGNDSNYDRFLYMDNSGYLHFGIYNNGGYLVSSPASYNDGMWHHAAVTVSSSAGSLLYVDGTLVAGNAAATTAQNYRGWWRIGENTINGWPNQPSSAYFNGLLDEVSIYDSPLTAAQIQSIYAAGGLGKAPQLVLPFGLALISPGNGTVVPPGQVPVVASVFDPSNLVAQVQIFQATNLLATITNSPYAFNWSVMVNGAYALTALATDIHGRTAAASLNFIVDVPPSVALTSPANNSRLVSGTNITISATASDTADSVVQVGFFQGTNVLGILTNAPYVLTWSNVPTGFYPLTAQAMDGIGVISTSAHVNVFVGNPFNVSITNPIAGSIVAVGTDISLAAATSGQDGPVLGVQFFQGATLLGSVTNAPYTLNLTNPPTGPYSVTAQAEDASGYSATSSVTTFYVVSQPYLTNLVYWWRGPKAMPWTASALITGSGSATLPIRPAKSARRLPSMAPITLSPPPSRFPVPNTSHWIAGSTPPPPRAAS